MEIRLTNGVIIEVIDESKVILNINKSPEQPEPIDLTKLLAGYEGAWFWSPCWGDCEFIEIHNRNGGRPMVKFRPKVGGGCRNVTPSGRLGYAYEGHGDCIIWPSKEHQTWNDWARKIV